MSDIDMKAILRTQIAQAFHGVIGELASEWSDQMIGADKKEARLMRRLEAAEAALQDSMDKGLCELPCSNMDGGVYVWYELDAKKVAKWKSLRDEQEKSNV